MPGRRNPRQPPEHAQAQHITRAFSGALDGASALPAPVTDRTLLHGDSKKSQMLYFYQDVFTATGGAQQVSLTYLPNAYSEHVYLRSGGAGGTYQIEGISWRRDAGKRDLQILTGMNARPGDVVVVEYAYYEQAPIAEEPPPYNMFAGPWRDPRIGAVYYKKDVVPARDSSTYYMIQSSVLTAGTGRRVIGGYRANSQYGNNGPFTNSSPGYVAGGGEVILLASNDKFDQLCGMMLFGTAKEQPNFRSWTPGRDMYFSPSPIKDEWNADPNIVGWELQGRCTFLDWQKLSGGTKNPAYKEWSTDGGYDTYWNYNQTESDPRVYSDTTLSDFTFIAKYNSRMSGGTSSPTGNPHSLILDQSNMQILPEGEYCPKSMSYSGAPLPRPPEDGSFSPMHSLTLTWSPNNMIHGWFVGWSQSHTTMTLPFKSIRYTYVTNQTSYGESTSQVMAELTTNLKWRFLYQSEPQS